MNAASRPRVLDDFSTLGDATRCRILLLLEAQELTVGDLCDVLQLPQSTVSRHLKTLADAGWIRTHRDGTRHPYRLAAGDLGEPAGQIWLLARDQIRASAAAVRDRRRLDATLRARRTRSRRFFARSADDWDALRDELFGTHFHQMALLGLLDPDLVVADLGCGTGRVSETLAPHVGRVLAVDDSEPMLQAARERLRAQTNVELRQGTLERLPVADAEVDAAMLVLVLHHVADPERIVFEARRVLRPAGRLVIADMLPHERSEYQHQMGHLWLGFEQERLARYLSAAGFGPPRFSTLTPDPAARGPELFVLTATAQRAPGDPHEHKRP